jgi:hypothetical protein
MASAGVLKPRPTSLYHRFSLVETTLPPVQTRAQWAIHRAAPAALTAGLCVLEQMLLLVCLFNLRGSAQPEYISRSCDIRTCSAIASVSGRVMVDRCCNRKLYSTSPPAAVCRAEICDGQIRLLAGSQRVAEPSRRFGTSGDRLGSLTRSCLLVVLDASSS